MVKVQDVGDPGDYTLNRGRTSMGQKRPCIRYHSIPLSGSMIRFVHACREHVRTEERVKEREHLDLEKITT